MDEVRKITLGIKEDISDFRQHSSNWVSEAIDEKLYADCGINSAILDEWLKNMEQLLMRQMDDLDRSINSPAVAQPLNEEGHVLDLGCLQRRNLFSYDVTFWCMTKDFVFPIECTRLHG